MKELKECPFCGGEARIIIHDIDEKPFMYFTRRYAVLCDWNNSGCGAEGRHEKIKSEAIKAWNTRAEPKGEDKFVEDIIVHGKHITLGGKRIDPVDYYKSEPKGEVGEPDTNFEFICDWFEKARENANKQGNNDSAKLWEDGLKHLKYYKALSHLKPLKELNEGEVLKFLENYWKSDRYSNFDGVDDEDLAKAITKTFGTQEKINIKCDICNKYSSVRGSLYFEPTDDPVLFKKTHICNGCGEREIKLPEKHKIHPCDEHGTMVCRECVYTLVKGEKTCKHNQAIDQCQQAVDNAKRLS